MKKCKKIVIGIILLVFIGAVTIGILFRKEIATLNQLELVNEYPFYEITYLADYGMSDFLEQGAASDEELTSFVTSQLLKGLPVEAHPDGACSTFHATTPEGDSLFGRNFDYDPSVILLLHTEPKDGYKSISIVNLSHIGYTEENLPDKSYLNQIQVLASPYISLDGMNDQGLAIGVLVVAEQVVHQSTGKTPITTTSAIRMILDRASTVEEAIELLESYDMNSSGDTGYHFQIADANGDTAVVEYVNQEMQVIRSKETNGFLAATNFTLSTQEQNGSGQDRYEILMDGLDRTQGIMSEEEAMELLKSAHFDGEEFANGDTSYKYYNSKTQWSAVYNLSQKTLKLCIGMDYDTVYTYSLLN